MASRKRPRRRPSTNPQLRRVHAQSGQVILVTHGDGDTTRDLVDQLHVQEIQRQCRFALRGLDDADRARRKMSREKLAGRNGAEYEEILWYSLQQVLVAVGNISKSLTGSASRTPLLGTARASRLQSALAIDVTRMPWLDRRVRNCFEHFDERLDELYEIDRAIVFDRRVAVYDASDPISLLDPSFVHWRWREYDALEESASFNNETIDLKQLRLDLDALLTATEPVLARRIESTGSETVFMRGDVPNELPVVSTTLDIQTLQGEQVWRGSSRNSPGP